MIAVTSALPREGKSTTALGLTRALATSGSRVILIDCDFRRSALNGMIGDPSAASPTCSRARPRSAR